MCSVDESGTWDTLDLEAARQYYRQREARRRAQRESERQRWLRRTREAVVRAALNHPGVRRVFLFGSLVKTGQFRADSDIDVAVECAGLEI